MRRRVWADHSSAAASVFARVTVSPAIDALSTSSGSVGASTAAMIQCLGISPSPRLRRSGDLCRNARWRQPQPFELEHQEPPEPLGWPKNLPYNELWARVPISLGIPR